MNNALGTSSTGVAALYCLFGDITWLPQSFNSVYPCVERVMFFLSTKPWYGQERAGSIEPAVIQALPDPEKKVEIITGDWGSEVEQRNISLAFAMHKKFTHALIVDADEVYESSELSAGISYARSRPEVSVWHVHWFTYWKSPKYRIEPLDPYQPPVFVKLGQVGFAETRNALGDTHELIPPQICMCHHLSYVLNEETLRSKHIMQPGHSQSAHPGWYEEKWRAWDNDHSIRDLHPVNPAWFGCTVEQPREALPEALRGHAASAL